MKTMLATMQCGVTFVGFYDAMSAEQVDYILEETKISTIFCTSTKAKAILNMQKKALAKHINQLVIFGVNTIDAELAQLGSEVCTTLYRFDQVPHNDDTPITPADKDDFYMISYTSGTTGNPKGVKIAHKKIMFNTR